MATMGFSSTKNQDVEDGCRELESIHASMGWCPLPQAKLASWDPDNEKQWAQGGERIATRNLLMSMPNLCCAFGVWLSWSIIVVKIQQMHDLDPTVYAFADWLGASPTDKDYKILLATVPAVAGLSGGILRICNSFLVPIAGGRNVVASNTLLLMIPMIMCATTLANPDLSFTLLITMAILSGVGGGAFASQMSNVSFLYPKTQQGYSLGMNGGLGNLGVSISQLLLPETMAWAAGSDPISTVTQGWPNHAGSFWWPICLVSGTAAFFWMSVMPQHGNHYSHDKKSHVFSFLSKDTLYNWIIFHWIEATGLVTAIIATVILTVTRDLPAFATAGGQVAHRFLLVIIAVVLEHLVLWYTSPKTAKHSIRDQGRIFRDKHTYIMTILYTMSFGSFIGLSGAFPGLIQSLFGYLTIDGCFMLEEANIFLPNGTPQHCVASGGVWGSKEIINPNAPNVFRYSWLGAFFGSTIRPIGGILADRYGGANVTMLLIIWCVIATICTGILIQKIYHDPMPEDLFGWFVFMFINLFFTVGAMNGTTFGTIGVLFEKDLAGPVLGWSSAIASFGSFLIPSMFTVAMQYDDAQAVLYGLAAFYTICGILNYYYYVRPGCEQPGV